MKSDRGGGAHPSFKHAPSRWVAVGRSVGVCWRRVSPVYRKATNATVAKNSAPKTNFLGRFFCAVHQDHKDFDAAHADIAFRPGLWRKLSPPWRLNIPARRRTPHPSCATWLLRCHKFHPAPIAKPGVYRLSTCVALFMVHVYLANYTHTFGPASEHRSAKVDLKAVPSALKGVPLKISVCLKSGLIPLSSICMCDRL